MLLNQNLSIKQIQTINFKLILTRLISLCTLTTTGTKYLKKLVYTLVNLVLNTLQIFNHLAKSAKYKNLQARKKQKQQAAANGEPED